MSSFLRIAGNNRTSFQSFLKAITKHGWYVASLSLIQVLIHLFSEILGIRETILRLRARSRETRQKDPVS